MSNPTPSPMYRVRLHIIASHPDALKDKEQHFQNTLVPTLKTVNELYLQAGVQFDFVPKDDVEYDGSVEKLERAALQPRASLYRGKLVFFYRGHDGTWSPGITDDYFHLDFCDGFNMAHELGHTFNLAHTHKEGRTLCDLVEIIREGVEQYSLGKQILQQITQAMSFGSPISGTASEDGIEALGSAIMNQAMDGDSVASGGFVSDTPASLHELPKEKDKIKNDDKCKYTLPSNFVYCEQSYPISVTFNNGYTHVYNFTPDVRNIMGYGHWGGCTPRYFSQDQIRIMRYSLEHDQKLFSRM